MSYRTILVHADESRRINERIKIAANIARTENGHLIGVAMTGVSKGIYPSGITDPNALNFSAILDLLREEAERALEKFETEVQRIGVPSFETRLVHDEAIGGISLLARYCDLVVIGQFDPDEPLPVVAPDFPENVVMNSARPVLIVPYAGQFDSIGKKVLVAWDASMTATRAVANAIPFLQRADEVEVAIFNPAQQLNVGGDHPGADIARYLARHDVKANVTRRTTTIPIGESLLSLATDLNSDLIVMGGYGHSRFREILLGGVTRTILESMTVPVLMSH